MSISRRFPSHVYRLGLQDLALHLSPGDGDGLLALTNEASADTAAASEPPREKSPSPVRGPSNALRRCMGNFWHFFKR